MSENKSTIGFHYGALAEKLEKQANKQGFTLGDEAKELQELADSIVLIRMVLDLPQACYQIILKKLNKRVSSCLKPLRKEGKRK